MKCPLLYTIKVLTILHRSAAAEAAAATEAASATWEATAARTTTWEASATSEATTSTARTFTPSISASEEIQTIADVQHGIRGEGIHLTVAPAVSIDVT